MPQIKSLCSACKVSFSVDGPISEEALQRVRTLFDKIRPSDVGLEQEAYIARNWNNPSPVTNGGREPNGTNQYMPPIKYLHIHECETFSMGIFCMPPSSIIPLHNHPGMTVLSKLLYGKLHMESYDWIDVNDQIGQFEARPAKLVKDCEMSGPQTMVLFPDRGGNIHTFRAITPCALFDVLCPPYLAGVGRDCSYFRKSSLNEPPALLPGDLNSSEVVWLEELEDHQPPEGFAVTRARPAKLVKDCEMSGPQTMVLFPDRGGNIHTFRAITPCALFDVLCPPYLAGVGRDCSYFRKSSLNEPPALLPGDLNSSEVVWLEELEDHQPPEGFAVTRGAYKGPVIR